MYPANVGAGAIAGGVSPRMVLLRRGQAIPYKPTALHSSSGADSCEASGGPWSPQDVATRLRAMASWESTELSAWEPGSVHMGEHLERLRTGLISSGGPPQDHGTDPNVLVVGFLDFLDVEGVAAFEMAALLLRAN